MRTMEMDETSPRTRMLDATIELIGSRSTPFRDATPERIESEAGVAAGTFAEEFEDEDAWLLAAMVRVLVRRRQDYESALAALAPEQRTIENGIDAIWSFFPGTVWNAWLVLFLAIRERPGLEKRSTEMTTGFDAGLAEIVRQFFEAEEGEMTGLIGLLMTTIDGLSLSSYVTEDLFDYDSMLTNLKRAITSAANA